MKRIIAISAFWCVAFSSVGCINPDVLIQAHQIMENAPTASQVQTVDAITEKETSKQETVTVDELVNRMDFFKNNCYYDFSIQFGYESLYDNVSYGELETRMTISHIKYDNIVFSDTTTAMIHRINRHENIEEKKIKEYNVFNDDGTMYYIVWNTGDDEWEVKKKSQDSLQISENDNYVIYDENHFKDAYIEETDEHYIIKNVGENAYVRDLAEGMFLCDYEECSQKIKITTSVYFEKNTKEIKEIVAEIDYSLLNAYHLDINMHGEYDGFYNKYLPAKVVVNNIKERTKEIPLPTGVELK